MAIALGDGELWGYGTHNRTMNGYRNQVFTGGFSIDKVTPGLFGTTSNTFGVSQKHLVVPSPFRTSFLAEIFSKTGESLGPLGEPLETNPEILKRNPVVNDTLWQHHGNSWLALFKFFPVLAVFDRNFQPVTQIGLNDPWIDTGFKKLISEGFDSSIPPLFSDFKIFENRIYLMCRGKLLQLDAKTGETLSRTTFFGEGLDFGKVAGEPLSFPFFTFLADGSLVLAHPMLLWNHDLWTTKPPSHRKAASGAGR